jgi:L-seryl-tRNA(Ser) seleniumtransferase
LAALEATLALYREPARAIREIPALAQLTITIEVLRRRAEDIVARVGDDAARAIQIVESEASVGGGAFPTARIPSIALAINGRADAIEARLRAGDPPLVCRVSDGRVLIDLRTIFPSEDAQVVAALRSVIS